MYVIAGMATIKSREIVCAKAIDSLIRQVSKLVVMCPMGVDVKPYLSSNSLASLGGTLELRNTDTLNGGDSRKFEALSYATVTKVRTPDVMLMSVDDDIRYPDDYVIKLRQMLQKHPNDVVAVHGSNLKSRSIQSYYRDKETFHYEHELKERTKVHFVGTGTCAWLQRLIKPHRLLPMPLENMADIWFSLHCKRRGIPMMLIPRSQGWMVSLLDNLKDTIWAHESVQDMCQTQIIQKALDQGILP